MNTTTLKILLSIGFATLIGGCANGPSHPSEPDPAKIAEIDQAHLIHASYQAVDSVLREIEHSRLRFNLVRSKPLIVTSFVNIDNVQQSSTFGRIVGEQVGSRFAQNGYPVKEVKLRADSIAVREATGELILSRQLQHLSFEHDAQAVVVGTYAQAKDFVYVTMKVIRARDGIIVYSYDYRMPMDADTKRLLNPRRRRV